jgi:hypothetical protein
MRVKHAVCKVKFGCLKIHSQSYVTTDDQSASLSWCQAPSGKHDRIFVTVRQLRV